MKHFSVSGQAWAVQGLGTPWCLLHIWGSCYSTLPLKDEHFLGHLPPQKGQGMYDFKSWC